LELGSEKEYRARTRSRLDGAEPTLSSASFSGGDGMGDSLFITRTGRQSCPAKSELDSGFFGTKRRAEPSAVSLIQSIPGRRSEADLGCNDPNQLYSTCRCAVQDIFARTKAHSGSYRDCEIRNRGLETTFMYAANRFVTALCLTARLRPVGQSWPRQHRKRAFRYESTIRIATTTTIGTNAKATPPEVT
jgi:hypothetical protein